MRRLIESGAVLGRNFVQVGLRGYWPPMSVLDWMREQGLRWHLMTEIEERGAEAVIDDAIGEALDGPDAIYLSVDIDVVDPGSAPGTGTPEPGGHAPARAAAGRPPDRRQVELAGMDIVEVSPPYDWAESTADAREPLRPRGDLGARREASRRRTTSDSRARRPQRCTPLPAAMRRPGPLASPSMHPGARDASPTPSRACTTST